MTLSPDCRSTPRSLLSRRTATYAGCASAPGGAADEEPSYECHRKAVAAADDPYRVRALRLPPARPDERGRGGLGTGRAVRAPPRGRGGRRTRGPQRSSAGSAGRAARGPRSGGSTGACRAGSLGGGGVLLDPRTG